MPASPSEPSRLIVRFRVEIASPMLTRRLYYLLKHYHNQWMTPSRMAQWQTKYLRRIVAHACKTVPYYRTLFERAKLVPGDISCLQDLAKIPITRKQDILNLPLRDRLSSRYLQAKLLAHPTGGSTGKVTDVCFTERYDDIRAANLFRTYLANGYRFTFTIANLQYLPLATNKLSRFGLLKRIGVPFHLPFDEQISLLASLRPQVIEGYPSRIALLARAIVDKKAPALNPRVVFTNSETLTDTLRRQIQDALGVMPTNVYEMWEFGTVAWECPRHQALHLSADHAIMEVLIDGREAPPGETGEIVGTNLFNYAMPFIRFATDDLGSKVATSCACGRTLPLTREVVGRATERLFLSDGRQFVATTQLDAAMYEAVGVREYQCVQRERGALEVLVVVDKRFTAKEGERVEKMLAELFRLERVRLERVESIPTTPVGKRKTFVSEILN